MSCIEQDNACQQADLRPTPFGPRRARFSGGACFGHQLFIASRYQGRARGSALKKLMQDRLIEHRQYIDKHGEDMP